MKILIQIHADNDLLCHEALSMAFALASFEHEIQLLLGDYLLQRLKNEPTGKFANMLSALDLYDMPNAWVDALEPLHSFSISCINQLTEKPDNVPNFDTIFVL